MSRVIETHEINKTYKMGAETIQALKSVSITVDRGEYVAFMGPSGSGKSTLIRCINRLEKFQNGKLYVDSMALHDHGINLTKLRAEIGFIFQSFNLIGDLTVYENVELPLTYRGMGKTERKNRVHEVLERVGMAHRAKHLPSQLSCTAKLLVFL